MGAAHQIRPQRHQEAAAEVISERDRADEFLAAAALLLGDGQRGGNDRAAGMGLGDRLEIIGLIGMGAHRVGKRRVDRRGAQIGADNRGLLGAAEPSHVDHGLDARMHPRTGNHRAEGVENAMLAFHEHRLRQRLIACRDHVACQPCRHSRIRRRGHFERRSRQRGGRAGRLQHAAARRPIRPGDVALVDHAQADTDILAISAALGRLSTFQQASITRRIIGAGIMPSARSANLVSSCWSVIGISTLPMA